MNYGFSPLPAIYEDFAFEQTPDTTLTPSTSPNVSPKTENKVDKLFNVNLPKINPLLSQEPLYDCTQYGCELGDFWDPNTPYDMDPSSIAPLQQEFHRASSLQYYQPGFSGHPHLLRIKEQLYTTWSMMLFNTTSTFFARIRCPRCGQLPISESYQGPVNHFMPPAMLNVWRLLIHDSMQLDPAFVNQLSMWEIERRFLEMEDIYWEQCEAGVACGRIAWNGTRAHPVI